MKETNKTHIIHFRLDTQYKKWLDHLVNENAASVTGYFYKLIYDQISKHIAEKAYNAGRDYASKEFGITDNICEAIKKPKDIKGLFGSLENEEKFLNNWVNESINIIFDLSFEFEIKTVDLLITLRNEFSDLFNEESHDLIEHLVDAYNLFILDKETYKAIREWQKTDEYRNMKTRWLNIIEKFVKIMIDKKAKSEEGKNANE